MITQQRLKELLEYDQETGLFRWKVKRRRIKQWGVAGTNSYYGYISICIDYKIYFAHRLAWLYVYGNFPEKHIDHINGDKKDNRIINLRPVTAKQNMENLKIDKRNTTGVRGVTFREDMNKYVARIRHHNKDIHLGSYTDIKEAATVVKNARNRLFTHHRTSYSS